jgi:hypothetical protein
VIISIKIYVNMQVEIESWDLVVTNPIAFLVSSSPLDIKGGVEAPQKTTDTDSTIATSNTRTHDVGLLSYGWPEAI